MRNKPPLDSFAPQEIQIDDREQNPIPVPRVSQGIAIFHRKAPQVLPLIDLADRRPYIAEERGRNQVEPDANYGESK